MTINSFGSTKVNESTPHNVTSIAFTTAAHRSHKLVDRI